MTKRGRPRQERKGPQMVRTSIYVEEDILALAGLNDEINISEICREAIVKAVGRPSARELDRKIKREKKKLEGLLELRSKATADKENFEAMIASFKGRKGSGVSTSDWQDKNWVEANQGRYGFRSEDSWELLAKLKDELRDQREIA